MGAAIQSELCLGCGLCENIVNDSDVLRVMGSGIVVIMDGKKIDDFISDKKRKRHLIRSCPMGAIVEIEGITMDSARAQIQHNSIEAKT